MASREVIEQSAPHIYLSALPFADRDSLIYKTFVPLCTGVVAIEVLGIGRHGGKFLTTLIGHEETVRSVAYAPDGRTLASCSIDGTVRVWDTRTGDELMPPLRSGDDSVRHVVFSPNGKSLALGTWARNVFLWSLTATQTSPQRLFGHSEELSSLLFSPDGLLLASASDGVRIWRSDTGEQYAVLGDRADQICSIAFSPSGAILASGSVGALIKLWRVQTRELLGQPLRGHSEGIISLSFSPDGNRLASGSFDHTIRLWEPTTRQHITTLHAHSAPVWYIQFSPDGQSILSSGGGIRIWTLQETATNASSILLDDEGRGDSIAFSPNGLYFASTFKDHIRIWDAVRTPAVVQQLPAPDGAICSMAISSNGTAIVSSSGDPSVGVWSLQTGILKFPSMFGHRTASSLATPMDIIQVVQSPTTESTRSTQSEREGCVLWTSVSSHEHLIASGSNDGTVQLWDAQTGEIVGQPLRNHQGQVNAVAFSPNGKLLASGSADETVHVWHVSSLQTLPFAPLICASDVKAVTFSSDSLILAAGDSTGHIHIWNSETGERLRQALHVGGRVLSIAFSCDGMLAVPHGFDVEVWNIITGKRIHVLDGHIKGILSVAYSLDGRMIGSGSADGTVRLWDTRAGTLLTTLHGHHGAVQSVAFTPDGKSIVSGSADRTIRVWDVAAALSIAAADGDDPVAALACATMRDGWLKGPSGELLLWVPAEYRQYLQVPPCTMCIDQSRVVITPCAEGLHAGESWTSCWLNNTSEPVVPIM